MSNLVLYKLNDIEIVVNTTNADIFTTQDGYRVLSNKSAQTVTRFYTKHGLRDLKPGTVKDVLTGDPVLWRYLVLIPAHIVLEGLMVHNPPLALAMGCKGAAVYLYGLAGFKVKVKLIDNPNKCQG